MQNRYHRARRKNPNGTLGVKVCVFIGDRCQSWGLQCAPTHPHLCSLVLDRSFQISIPLIDVINISARRLSKRLWSNVGFFGFFVFFLLLHDSGGGVFFYFCTCWHYEIAFMLPALLKAPQWGVYSVEFQNIQHWQSQARWLLSII